MLARYSTNPVNQRKKIKVDSNLTCIPIGCTSRFTHANRHCAEHPYATLQRTADLHIDPKLTPGERTEEVSAKV